MTRPVTQAQKDYIETLLGEIGSDLFNYGIDHGDIDRLTVEEASNLIDAIKQDLGWMV